MSLKKLWDFIKELLLYIVLTTRDAFVGNVMLFILAISTPIITPIIFVVIFNIIQGPDSNTPKTPTSIGDITTTDEKKSTAPIDVQPKTLAKDSEGKKRKTARSPVDVQPKTRPPVSKTQTPINVQIQNETKKSRERVRLVHQDFKKLTREAEKIKRDQKEMSEKIEQLRKKIGKTDN